MIEENQQEVDFRLRGYNRKNYDYTSARYSLPSMRFYSNLRTVKISNLVSKNITKEGKNDILDIIIDGLKVDGYVKIHNFGSFKIKKKKSRIGRNPKTKEKKIISERKVVLFKPSKEFKNFVNFKNE